VTLKTGVMMIKITGINDTLLHKIKKIRTNNLTTSKSTDIYNRAKIRINKPCSFTLVSRDRN